MSSVAPFSFKDTVANQQPTSIPLSVSVSCFDCFEKTEIAQKGRRGIEAGQLFSNVSIAIMGLGWHADVSDVIVNS